MDKDIIALILVTLGMMWVFYELFTSGSEDKNSHGGFVTKEKYYNTHVDRFKEEPQEWCPLCGWSGDTKDALRTHIRNYHDS